MRTSRAGQIRLLDALWSLRELRIRSKVAHLQMDHKAAEGLLSALRGQLAQDSLDLADRHAAAQCRLHNGEAVRLLALEQRYRAERSARLGDSAANLEVREDENNQTGLQLQQYGNAHRRLVIKRRAIQDRLGGEV